MISIIIPTYRRSDFIVPSLETVIMQTFKDIEIIVIDDNGINTEEQIITERKVHEFIENNPNICILYFSLDQNYGACFARNYGASKARGNYLAFLDDDDLWHVNKLKLQENILSSNENISFCYCPQDFTVRKSIFKLYFGNLQSKLYSGNIVGSSSNPLIRKNNFVGVNGFDNKFKSCQDWDLWVRLISTGPAEYINEKLVLINNDNRSRISTNYKNGVQGQWQFFTKHWLNILINPFSFIVFSLKFIKRIYLLIFN